MSENKLYHLDQVRLIFHEFKTPLTIIKSQVDLAHVSSSEPFVQQRLEKVMAIVDRLSASIEAFLSAASIDVAALTIDDLNVTELIREEIDFLESVAHQRDIHMTYSHPKRPIKLQASREALRSIASNLIMNAIKYNRDGGEVTVNLKVKKGVLHFSVRDQGEGIAEIDRPHVFLPLYRSRAAKTSVEGTGLGLTLVKRLTEGLGGRVWFETAEGEGTTFYVELPLTREPSHVPLEPNDGVHDHLQEGADRRALDKDRDQSPIQI